MDKQNTGHASNSKGTTMMTALQRLMKEEAELKKQLEAAKHQGEKQKARIKNFDPEVARVLNGNFEGIGLGELEVYDETLVEILHEIDDHTN